MDPNRQGIPYLDHNRRAYIFIGSQSTGGLESMESDFWEHCTVMLYIRPSALLYPVTRTK
jgi:hypothetical protein